MTLLDKYLPLSALLITLPFLILLFNATQAVCP